MDNFVKIELPSKCRVYKNVDPAQIEIRVLKGKDEKLLAETTMQNFEKKFAQVLQNLIKGIKVEDLTLGDRKYIMLWLAVNSMSKDYPIEFDCEFCGQKIETIVDLSTIETIDLASDLVEPYTVQLSNDKEVKMRLFRVSDEIRIEEYQKSSNAGDVYIYRNAITIVDDKMNIVEKMNMLEDLDSNDLAQIRAFHEQFQHGPIMEAKYECPKCGSLGGVTVPFRISMFMPFGKTLKRNFGKKLQSSVSHANGAE